MTVVAFSQRDPRWADNVLGSSDLTLGQAGCLVSAAASMLASWGMVTDPERLNEVLRRSSGYVDGCLFVFAAIDGLGARFVALHECQRTPAPVAALANVIAGGGGVLAQVDWRPGGEIEPHWVWVTELSQEHGRIVDPWQPAGCGQVDLATYLDDGWSPARGIFMAAVYQRVEMTKRWAWTVRELAAQPAVCRWTAQGGAR